MSIESWIAEINAVGYRLNNLFEREDGLWQANARNHEFACDFGLGTTPCEALEACFDRIHTGCVSPLTEQSDAASIAPVVDLRTILALQPTPIFRRR